MHLLNLACVPLDEYREDGKKLCFVVLFSLASSISTFCVLKKKPERNMGSEIHDGLIWLPVKPLVILSLAFSL